MEKFHIIRKPSNGKGNLKIRFRKVKRRQSTSFLASPTVSVDEEQQPGEYEVERIVAKRIIGDRIQYYIKWKYWSSNHNTWESLDNLNNCRDAITDFERQRKKQSSTSKRPKKTTSVILKKKKSRKKKVKQNEKPLKRYRQYYRNVDVKTLSKDLQNGTKLLDILTMSAFESIPEPERAKLLKYLPDSDYKSVFMDKNFCDTCKNLESVFMSMRFGSSFRHQHVQFPWETEKLTYVDENDVDMRVSIEDLMAGLHMQDNSHSPDPDVKGQSKQWFHTTKPSGCFRQTDSIDATQENSVSLAQGHESENPGVAAIHSLTNHVNDHLNLSENNEVQPDQRANKDITPEPETVQVSTVSLLNQPSDSQKTVSVEKVKLLKSEGKTGLYIKPLIVFPKRKKPAFPGGRNDNPLEPCISNKSGIDLSQVVPLNKPPEPNENDDVIILMEKVPIKKSSFSNFDQEDNANTTNTKVQWVPSQIMMDNVRRISVIKYSGGRNDNSLKPVTYISNKSWKDPSQVDRLNKSVKPSETTDHSKVINKNDDGNILMEKFLTKKSSSSNLNQLMTDNMRSISVIKYPGGTNENSLKPAKDISTKRGPDLSQVDPLNKVPETNETTVHSNGINEKDDGNIRMQEILNETSLSLYQENNNNETQKMTEPRSPERYDNQSTDNENVDSDEAFVNDMDDGNILMEKILSETSLSFSSLYQEYNDNESATRNMTEPRSPETTDNESTDKENEDSDEVFLTDKGTKSNDVTTPRYEFRKRNYTTTLYKNAEDEPETKKSRHHKRLKISKSDGMWTCSRCRQHFSSHSNLSRHERQHSNTKAYPCQRCDAAFDRPDSLKNHQNVHGIYHFKRKCPSCGKKYKSKSGFYDHLKVCRRGKGKN